MEGKVHKEALDFLVIVVTQVIRGTADIAVTLVTQVFLDIAVTQG